MKLRIHAAASAAVAAITTVIFATVAMPAMRLQSTHTHTEQPEVVMAVAPIFPPVAVASNTSGRVVIEVQVDAKGTVSMAKIVDGDALFRQGKIYEATARRWRFAAAKDGAGLRTARLTFVFKIMPNNTPSAELTSVFMPPYQVEVRHKPFEPVVDKQASK
jgi:TonB family protein